MGVRPRRPLPRFALLGDLARSPRCSPFPTVSRLPFDKLRDYGGPLRGGYHRSRFVSLTKNIYRILTNFAPQKHKIMRVTLVQTDLFWEDAAQNRAMLDQKLQNIQPTDLVVLPEMFTTGFSMRPHQIAETTTGETMQWLTQWAKKLNAAITGSLIIQSGQNYLNRMIWVQPDGHIEQYDKKHLFTLGGEHQHYTAGNDRVTVEWRGCRFRLQICYDLRFPVWSRNHDNYDALIYVANWPERRAHAWRTLLMARAIENQSYVIGVNRIGTDGNGLHYIGDSTVIDYLGTPIFEAKGTEQVGSCTLNKHELASFRTSLPFLTDRDKFDFV